MMDRKDYLDTLQTFVDEPESVGMSEEIIPVAMWLRGWMPADDGEADAEMHSSSEILGMVADIAVVTVNAISKLMVMNGYTLSEVERTYPRWVMKPVGD